MPLIRVTELKRATTSGPTAAKSILVNTGHIQTVKPRGDDTGAGSVLSLFPLREGGGSTNTIDVAESVDEIDSRATVAARFAR